MPAPLGLTIHPEYETLAYNERRGTFVVRVKPPPAPQTRPPLRLVLAIDTSGSMHGAKITTALASARAVLKALAPTDTFSCVTFSGKVQVLLPMTAMDAHGKQLASQALSSVQARGNTNISGAILSSFELCSGKGHVVLLTDGCPTEGVSSPDQLLQLTRGAARGATLSAFGFGRDVNPLLLSSLAESGRGNYTFIEDGEPPVEAIAAEVGGLLMTTAANFQLTVRPAAGVVIEKTLRTSDLRQDGGSVILELPALIAEEDVTLPLTLHWDEGALGGTIATVSAQAYEVSSGALLQEQAALMPRFSAARGVIQRDAAREILLGRSAMMLRYASQASGRPGNELASELAELHKELSLYAGTAKLSEDAQVIAALAMLDDARKGLASRGAAQQAARQDMVATSMALSRKRSTMMGMKDASQKASQQAFATHSQLAGIDLIRKMNDDSND